MSKNLKTQWRVQTKEKSGKWRNRGLYEVRVMARHFCFVYREVCGNGGVGRWKPPYGFGNTRTVKYIKA